MAETPSTKLALNALPRRMSRHLAIGPQYLSADANLPMQRFHVEEQRGVLELRCDCPAEWVESIQWTQNGTPIPGKHGVAVTLGELTAADGDIYFAQWTDSQGQLGRSQACLVIVVPGLTLTDQSARGLITPDHPLILGFVIGRSSESAANPRYLLRVLGPSLQQFDVPGGLNNPKVSLFRRGKPCDHLLKNDSEFAAYWSPKVGAFALNKGSEEFVAKAELPAGHYTLHVESTDGLSGQALVEVYQTTAID